VADVIAWVIWADRGRMYRVPDLKPLYYSSTLNNSEGIEF